MPRLKSNLAMKTCSMPLQVAQSGPWILYTNATAASFTLWHTAWSLTTRLLKIYSKTHFLLSGDEPLPFHRKLAQREAGSSPSCITGQSTIYVVLAVAPLFKRHH